jgi:NAD-dependent deacetylase
MSELNNRALIEKASRIIQSSQFCVVLTGAGISTPSGVPDFRSPVNGLWAHQDPMTVASLSTFTKRPDRFYAWLAPLAKKIISAQPSAAHLVLTALEKAGFIKAVITQNVDRLHQMAGSKHVVELHGNLANLICERCGKNYPVSIFLDEILNQTSLPLCTICHTVLKPDMVLYEQMLDEKIWAEAVELCQKSDLIFVIGTSLTVTPASSLPLLCCEHGGRVIINTLSPTYLDKQADVLLSMDVIEAIPEIGKSLLLADA